MNSNLEEEAKKFYNRIQEISFSKSNSIHRDILSSSFFEKKNEDSSAECFMGANTRRQLLDNVGQNGVAHPREDEPIQFSLRDNIDLENIREESKEAEEIHFQKQPKPQEFDLELSQYNLRQFSRKQEENEKKTIPDEKIQGQQNLWKTNFFIIVYFVNLFISKMKRSSCLYMRKRLVMQHFSILDDKSYFPTISKKTIDQKTIDLMRNQNYFLGELRKNATLSHRRGRIVSSRRRNRIKRKLKYYFLLMKRWLSLILSKISYFLNVMTPDKKIRLLWDSCIGVILFMQIIYVPVYVSFTDEYSDSTSVTSSSAVEKPMIFIFFGDIFLNFFTGYYKKGVFIDDKQKIAKHYLKRQFFLDLIPLVFLVLVYWHGYSKFFSLFFMINIAKIKKISHRIEETFHLHLRFSSLLRLFKLAFLMLFLSHISACSWHLLGVLEISSDPNQITWLHVYDLLNQELNIRYIFSFYFSIVTIVTVGYGDITPQTSVERVFSCLLILIGCGTFGYCLSNLGSIFMEMSMEENNYKMKIAEINDYMSRNSVNFNLQIKVRRYLEYLFNEEKEGDIKGQAILQNLSKSLKEELLMDVYGKIMGNIHFLNGNFSGKFLKALALKFKEISYAPEEIIFKQNQNSEENNLYFIKKGSVEIFIEFNNGKSKKLNIIKAQETFGHYSFITGLKREYSTRSVNVCRLLVISRSDFQEVLEAFPKDLEKFFFLRDSFLLYNDYEKIGLRCYLCNLPTHTILNCPTVHFPINRDAIIRRYLFSDIQNRKMFKKRSKMKFNSRQIKRVVENDAFKHKLKLISSFNKRKNIFQDSQDEKMENSEASISLLDSQSDSDDNNEDISVHSEFLLTKNRIEEDFDINPNNDKKINFQNMVENLANADLSELSPRRKRERDLQSTFENFPNLGPTPRHKKTRGNSIDPKINFQNPLNVPNLSPSRKNRGISVCKIRAPHLQTNDENSRDERLGSLFTKSENKSVWLSENNKSDIDMKETKKNSLTGQNFTKKNSLAAQNFNLAQVYNYSIKKESRLFMMDFEAMKIYTLYFPHNNVNKILQQSWYTVGTLGYKRSLSPNTKLFQIWKRKKGTKRKKVHSSAGKKHQSTKSRNKTVTFV